MRDHHGSEHRSHRQPRARNRCSTEGPGRDCPLPNRSPQRELGDCDVAHRLKTARLKRWAAWLRGGKRDGVCARSPRARARGLYEGLRPPCRIEALSASWGTATERTSWRQPGSSGDAYPGRHGRHGCGVASETAFVPAVPGLAPGACMSPPEGTVPCRSENWPTYPSGQAGEEQERCKQHDVHSALHHRRAARAERDCADE